MRNDPEDGVQGGATLWKLTQAITHMHGSYRLKEAVNYTNCRGNSLTV